MDGRHALPPFPKGQRPATCAEKQLFRSTSYSANELPKEEHSSSTPDRHRPGHNYRASESEDLVLTSFNQRTTQRTTAKKKVADRPHATARPSQLPKTHRCQFAKIDQTLRFRVLTLTVEYVHPARNPVKRGDESAARLTSSRILGIRNSSNLVELVQSATNEPRLEIGSLPTFLAGTSCPVRPVRRPAELSWLLPPTPLLVSSRLFP